MSALEYFVHFEKTTGATLVDAKYQVDKARYDRMMEFRPRGERDKLLNILREFADIGTIASIIEQEWENLDEIKEVAKRVQARFRFIIFIGGTGGRRGC